MSASLFARVACETCGPLEPPLVHRFCHPDPPNRDRGCGHALDDHSNGLRCRVCGEECGIDCTLVARL